MESAVLLPPEVWLKIMRDLDAVSLVRLYLTGAFQWARHDATFRALYGRRKEEYHKDLTIRALKALCSMPPARLAQLNTSFLNDYNTPFSVRYRKLLSLLSGT